MLKKKKRRTRSGRAAPGAPPSSQSLTSSTTHLPVSLDMDTFAFLPISHKERAYRHPARIWSFGHATYAEGHCVPGTVTDPAALIQFHLLLHTTM